MKTVKAGPYNTDTFEQSESEQRMAQDAALAQTARICVTVVAVFFLIGLTICSALWICHR